jgi:hypothetical protein
MMSGPTAAAEERVARDSGQTEPAPGLRPVAGIEMMAFDRTAVMT